MATKDHHPGSFQIDGLNVTGITGLELQIDSVSTDPNTPYLITHNVVQTVGQAPEISSDLSGLLHTADTWNLLTVCGSNMSGPTTLATQAIDHAAAQAHLPTSLPADQLGQAIAANFPPPAIANTAETPAAETVAAHVPLTFPGQHQS
jgi:hypothetical protein